MICRIVRSDWIGFGDSMVAIGLEDGDDDRARPRTIRDLLRSIGAGDRPHGDAFAYATFMKAKRLDAYEPAVLKKAWGIDTLYAAVIVAPGQALSAFAAYVVDARVIDGVVNGMGTVVRGGGDVLRKVQTGYVRNYALGVAFGATVLLGWVMVRSGV